jgi:hypothetical protein
VLGRCKPSETIHDERAVSELVANSALAYALFEGEGARNVVEIDLRSGDSRVVGTGFSLKTSLALAADRLYAFDGVQLMSKDLAGGSFQIEPLSVGSIGGSADGFYYAQNVYEPGTGLTTGSLSFRPAGASTSETIWRGGEIEIIASDQDGVAVKQRLGGELKLLFVTENKVRDLFETPNWVSVQVVRQGVAMLVVSATAASGYELWWITAGRPTAKFPLEPELRAPILVKAPGAVAILLRDGRSAFVRLFDEYGPTEVPLGISYDSSLAFVDSRYVWFTWRSTDEGTPSFRRARQVQPGDFSPTK